MVGVEENWRALCLAQAPDDRYQLRDTDEATLALGGTDDDGNLVLLRGFDNPVERHQIRHIEVTYGGFSSVRLLQCFEQGHHLVATLAGTADRSIGRNAQKMAPWLP